MQDSIASSKWSLASAVKKKLHSIQVDLSAPPPKITASFLPSGPFPSPLMIVGEAPGEKEVEKGIPFIGPSGYLLDEVLKGAGLLRGMAFVTNVCLERPPENKVEEWMASTIKERSAGVFTEIQGQWVNEKIRLGREVLLRQVAACKPTVIVALGNLALWALTGKWGIRKWRGSVMQIEINGHYCKVIPAIHPAAVLREQSIKNTLINDFRRAAIELKKGCLVDHPRWRFRIRPSFQEARDALEMLLYALDGGQILRLAADIETRAGHTACLGIAWTRRDAICIPFMCVENLEGYWSLDEEVELIWLIRKILSHRNARVIWQNGSYDHQYEWRWHYFLPRIDADTMLTQHAIWSISTKSLDYLSSIYCDYHYYWKEDGKLWDPSIPEDEFWAYNCEDCVRTYEIAEAEEGTVNELKKDWPELPSVIEFQHKIQPVCVRIMNRGLRADEKKKRELSSALERDIERLEREIEEIAGQPLNVGSNPQMTGLFYGQLALTPVFKRNPDGTRGNPTCDDDALDKVGSRVPLLQPLIQRIKARRSAGVFHSNYFGMRPDYDGRYRTEYKVGGTKTYRLASTTNAFGSGGNFQNLSDGEIEEVDEDILKLPNVKEVFLFDLGKTGFELDGDSADLRIVTAESGCKQMQAYFAAGAKPYIEIAKEYYRDPTIKKGDKRYKRMKALCHGTNYGGEGAGLAARIGGLSVDDVERIQRWYFGMCPEIKEWQEDIKAQIEKRGFIQNPFGNRLYNWDRVSRKLFNEALAWTPQSTVGLWINRIMLALDNAYGDDWLELLAQTHDSTTGQFPTERSEECQRLILATANAVVIPCKTGPITVPCGLKLSTTSWGACA